MRILGLDASTTTIGWSIIEFNEEKFELKTYGYYKPLKDINIFESLNETRKFVQDLVIHHMPDEVVIEEFLLFMKGKSNAKTISSLAILNRTVGLACFNVGKMPTLLSVTKVRHAIKKDKVLPPKEDIPELVSSYLNKDFPWQYSTKGRAKGKPIIENYDIADSIALCIALIKLKQKEKIKKVKKNVKISRDIKC